MTTVAFHSQSGSRGARLVWPSGLTLELGMSVREALSILRDEVSGSIELVFDDAAVSNEEVDISVVLVSLGLRLRFDPLFQRLRIIDVFDPTKITITFGIAFTGRTEPTTKLVHTLFGAAYPGRLEDLNKVENGAAGCDEMDTIYMVQFPQGICFQFPVPATLRPIYVDREIAFRAPESAPAASRIFIFYGHDLLEAALPPPQATTFGGGTYMEPVEVVLGVGCPSILRFPSRTTTSKEITLDSSTPQDVMSILGAPVRFWSTHPFLLSSHFNFLQNYFE